MKQLGAEFQVTHHSLNIVLFREGAVSYFMGIEITIGALADTPGEVNVKRCLHTYRGLGAGQAHIFRTGLL